MSEHYRPLVPVNPQGLDEIAAALLNSFSDAGNNTQGAGEVNVQGNIDFWKIDGVEYRNGIYSVDLAKKLLDNGSAKTQDDWAAYALQQQRTNGFSTPNYQLLHATVRALFNGRNGAKKKEVEEARVFLEKESKAHWLMTLTRIQYQPKGLDTVVHNYKLSDKFEVKQDFVGNDSLINTATNAQAVCKTLLGSNNISEIQDIYKWLGTQNGAYISRLNSRPKVMTERVARFNAGSDRAYLLCDGDPTDANPSLGVRSKKI